ncbi:MAG: S26 family signal peptidase [Synergistaceae bacterium]|jgi:type IV secretory pathway protease TraF|nr:S26 family signal peptidase [Synergistaceae bacterium]
MKIDVTGLRNLTLILICVALAVAAFPVFDLRINITSSHVPVGLWRSYPATAIEAGDVVVYDIYDLFLENPQIYADGMTFESSRIIKIVAALPGAMIERSGDEVIVDGTRYPSARILKKSWCNVEYPMIVPDGSVWLMADVSSAFDSRYHGPVPAGLIREKVSPVLVWK